MADDQEILAQTSDLIRQQQRAAASTDGSQPRRLSFEERLERIPSEPDPTPEQVAMRQQVADELRAKADAIAAMQREQAILAQVGRRYAGADLASFNPPTDDAREVLAAVCGYANRIRENVDAGRGIVLLGRPGTGKDHLIVGVLRQAARAGFRVQWVDGAELFAAARDNIDSGDTEARWARRFTDPDILAISDPVPPAGEVREGWQISTLFRIVDRRYRDMKPTFITINVKDAAEAAGRMSGNIVDRLSHGSLVLKCNWPSYRKPLS